MLNAARRRQSREAVLTVLGGSGYGKSSIVRAGVIPRLRRDPQWLVIEPFRPGREPIQELAAGLIRTFDRDTDEMQDLVAELEGTSIPEVLARLRRTSHTPEATPLLVVDQFEELLSTDNPRLYGVPAPAGYGLRSGRPRRADGLHLAFGFCGRASPQARHPGAARQPPEHILGWADGEGSHAQDHHPACPVVRPGIGGWSGRPAAGGYRDP